MDIKEIARVIWNIRREDEDKCDLELEDIPQTHSVWKEAEALVAEIQRQSEPVFAFRRKGLDDFCTCDERRYNELAQKPNLFEVKMFFTFPPDKAKIEQAAVQNYKDSVLKEVGEPVAHMYPDKDGPLAGKCFVGGAQTGDIDLFTADQLIAARKPLEEEIAILTETKENVWSALKKTEQQLKAAQEEIERLKRERLITADAIETLNSTHKEQLATAEQRVAEAWQPIETAPKDGTSVLLLFKGCAIEALWECVDSGDWESGLQPSYYWSSKFDWFDDGTEPTHWMPLPNPPATGASL